MSDTEPTSKSKSVSDLVSMTELDGMGAETGFGEDEQTPTIRVSGFLSLLLGLVGSSALMGSGGIAVALLAILFGLIAVRPVKFGRASGIMAGKIGIALGVGFALCGYFVPYFKTQSLGAQAEKFTKDYIDVVNSGNEFVAIELQKPFHSRFSKSMPLKEYYEAEERKMLDASGGKQSNLRNHRDDTGTQAILRQGPDATWVLERPVRVYHQYRIDRAEVIMIEKGSNSRLRFFLHYKIDPNDVGQWHIEVCQPYRERYVAESIL